MWSPEALRGRMFVQFVALCYYEYFNEKLRQIKALNLGEENGDPAHDNKKKLELEQKLRTWLTNTPLYGVLQWFDVVEEATISTQLKKRRWNTEMIKQDHLFLFLLGMEKDPPAY